MSEIKTNKYIVFGGAGCLNKQIAHRKVMIPTLAYRDEGTSYHYAPASDYIIVKNADIVAGFMEENDIPYVKGKTWTTDAFYRETVNSFEKHKADGCISVEMECAVLQAVCDFRELNLYTSLRAAICLTHLNGMPDEKKDKPKVPSMMSVILILHWNWRGMSYNDNN